VTFDFAAAGEPRVLELVNKTNQFNLNGTRYTQPDWQKLLSSPGALLVAVSYEDKFGPLGTIAAVAGHADGKRLTIDTWVMSCRAFARRIEHQTLKMLFDTTGAKRDRIPLHPTAKNGPLRDFFATLAGRGAAVGVPPDAFPVRSEMPCAVS
jgi:FkbH-like protein